MMTCRQNEPKYNIFRLVYIFELQNTFLLEEEMNYIGIANIIDDFILQVYDLLEIIHHSKHPVTIKTPIYIKFKNELTVFIYQHKLNDYSEWKEIQGTLIVKSNQYLSSQEANYILSQLENLKTVVLANQYKFQSENYIIEFLHSSIQAQCVDKFYNGHYADAVESGCKEINARLKKIYKNKTGEEKDGDSLFTSIFSRKNPILQFEDIQTKSGDNVQFGYMLMFQGMWLGLRDSKAHENMHLTKEQALERLVFLSMLMNKIDVAVKYSNISEY